MLAGPSSSANQHTVHDQITSYAIAAHLIAYRCVTNLMFCAFQQAAFACLLPLIARSDLLPIPTQRRSGGGRRKRPRQPRARTQRRARPRLHPQSRTAASTTAGTKTRHRQSPHPPRTGRGSGSGRATRRGRRRKGGRRKGPRSGECLWTMTTRR